MRIGKEVFPNHSRGLYDPESCARAVHGLQNKAYLFCRDHFTDGWLSILEEILKFMADNDGASILVGGTR
jgi:hypothetical protein